MKEIDWSKAPEGATHWELESDDWYASWMKCVGDEWFFWEVDGNKGWVRDRRVDGHRSRISNMIPRPVASAPAVPAWAGTGLPPVGTACEMWHEKIGDWLKAEVAFVGEQILVVRYHSIVHGHHEAAIMNLDSEKLLRLPRTPEQIAAEERDKAIDVIARDLNLTEDFRFIAERVYRANYRRQEPKE